MDQKIEIASLYKEAGCNERLSMFMMYPDLRSIFTAIEQKESPAGMSDFKRKNKHKGLKAFFLNVFIH